MITGTLLFVPGDRPDRFAKAAAFGADHVIIDLEDAVAPAKKDAARGHAATALEQGFVAIVRINAIGTPMAEGDLAILRTFAPTAVMIPKVASAADIVVVSDAVPNVPLVPLIETVDGMVEVDAIASAAGVAAIAFGAYDLCAELGARPVSEILAPYRARIVLAARYAHVACIDSPYADLDDAEALARDAVLAAAAGFDGKLAVHPKQVPIIRNAFTPSAEEIAAARATIAVGEMAGVARAGSEMVDAPMVAAARRLLARTKGD